MYKKLQVRIDEIKNDFKIGSLKECERKLEELKENLYLTGYLVSSHAGKTIFVNGGNSYLNYQEKMSEKELKYEIDKLEEDIKIGILPIDYDVSGKKLKEVILINAKEKKLTKEKLSEILNLIKEIKEKELEDITKVNIDVLKSFYEKMFNEVLQEYN